MIVEDIILCVCNYELTPPLPGPKSRMWPAPIPREKTIAKETDTEYKHANGARGTSHETEEMKGGSQTRLVADISMADLLTGDD